MCVCVCVCLNDHYQSVFSLKKKKKRPNRTRIDNLLYIPFMGLIIKDGVKKKKKKKIFSIFVKIIFYFYLFYNAITEWEWEFQLGFPYKSIHDPSLHAIYPVLLHTNNHFFILLLLLLLLLFIIYFFYIYILSICVKINIF